MKWLAIFGTVMAAAIAPATSLAGPIGRPSDCVQDLLFDSKAGELAAAKVVGVGKVQFQDDAAGCPGSAPSCRMAAYVIKGDVVVVGHQRGDWSCVRYPSRSGGKEGWVRSDQISRLPAAAPPLSSWAGTWESDLGASIKIKVKNADLIFDGHAEWIGANPGQVNVGEIDARLRPKDGVVQIEDYCAANFRLLGPYLVVADGNSCGGLNVTFTGVYRRVRR